MRRRGPKGGIGFNERIAMALKRLTRWDGGGSGGGEGGDAHAEMENFVFGSCSRQCEAVEAEEEDAGAGERSERAGERAGDSEGSAARRAGKRGVA